MESLLRAESFGNPRQDYDEVSSTLDIAREIALLGAPHGTLITAKHQSAGRGRRKAKWVDELGQSALLTYIMRPVSPEIVNHPWRLAFAASLAVALAIRDSGLSEAQVKWPNDIVCEGRKLAGLILETVNDKPDSVCYLLGIGINVLQLGFEGEEEFIQPPTSIAIEMGKHNPTVELPEIDTVVDNVSARLGDVMDLCQTDPQKLMENWRSLQITGQFQRGIALNGTHEVSGEYVDVRVTDGAGLIRVDSSSSETVAVLPAR